ncbi:M15 family metallopeptidase [Pedobacter sp. MR2016-24]|uniref:M15 family metallopeptidase n=1 Tax=Pedobacter sp. MR2016-24 TaxID=2994466 RepID=UPI002245B17F|nr:M15 family metallopeptidase [Pedobacter sp. MR2016-24]MCX2486614.1 M15 family metallopeptidase [Pedobacter sp. MR2016-24]
MEKKSIERLNALHPLTREKALVAYAEAVAKTPKGVHPFITQTLRTFEESDALYALGRTKVNPDGKTAKKPLGNIVTNAKAGQSYHNYGLALDFCLQIDGKTSWGIDENWLLVIEIFKKHGFESGNDWKKFKDAPHLEMRMGNHWKQLLILHNSGKIDKDGYVII